MKTRILLFIAAVGLLFPSCSSSDDDGGQDDATNYFPLTANSYWTYNNTSEGEQTRDSLYVNGTQQINGETATNLDARTPITGLMTNFLTQGVVQRSDNRLLINGEFSSAFIEGFPEISVPLNDFVLFDASETTIGTELSSVNGEIMQEVMDVPLLITYEFRSVSAGFLMATEPSETPPVLRSDLQLQLTVTAEIELAPGLTVSIPVLATQEVLLVQNSYASDIGLTQSDVTIMYQLEDLSGSGIELPFPSEGMIESTQEIDTFVVSD